MMINGREGADHINDSGGSSKLDQGGRRPGNTVAVAAATSSASASSTTSSWSRLKDPRIVRVSRAFGGKDRHSKVCTVRGLRDRRVRLSVPTAIQLYDLQDRLGLNQPSKVVDWLLNAAKHEIDELPPLQMLPSSSPNFITTHNYFHPTSRSGGGLVMKIGNSSTTGSSMINWDVDDGSAILRRNKAKEEEEDQDESAAATARETNVEQPVAAAAAEEEDHEDDDDDEEEQGADRDNSNKCRQSHFDEEINVINNHGGSGEGGGGYINVSPSNNFFSSRHNSSSTVQPGLGLLNNISSHHDDDQQQYSSLIRWDPSTLSLAQAQSQSQSQSQPPAVDEFHNNINVVSLGSGLPHHQLLVYQPGGSIAHAAQYSASYFPYSHITGAGAAAASSSTDYAPKQINFQMLMSSTNIPPNNNSVSNSLTPPNEGRPFHFTTNFLPTHKDCGK